MHHLQVEATQTSDAMGGAWAIGAIGARSTAAGGGMRWRTSALTPRRSCESCLGARSEISSNETQRASPAAGLASSIVAAVGFASILMRDRLVARFAYRIADLQENPFFAAQSRAREMMRG